MQVEVFVGSKKYAIAHYPKPVFFTEVQILDMHVAKPVIGKGLHAVEQDQIDDEDQIGKNEFSRFAGEIIEAVKKTDEKKVLRSKTDEQIEESQIGQREGTCPKDFCRSISFFFFLRFRLDFPPIFDECILQCGRDWVGDYFLKSVLKTMSQSFELTPKPTLSFW
jgi:hypothetical protein